MFSPERARLAAWFLGIALAISAVTLDAMPARAGILDASWTAPITNADGSPLTDLASYRFYYATSTTPCPGSAFVSIPSSTLSPGAGETVAVTITGLRAGTQYYASVTAVDTTGGESDCFTPVQTAVARIDFAVTPTTTTSFGSPLVGDFVDRTFTVENTGGGTIAGTVTTSAPFSVVSGGSFSLAGLGATHVATVRFRPTVASTVSANVNFTTTSGDTISRLVTGTGTATGGGGDLTPPTVVITGPTSLATYTTSSLSLTLSGTAADDVGVTQVTWASSPGGSGTATGTATWSAGGIVLVEGANVLTVTARDAAGNVATDTLTVTVPSSVDTTPPVVSLTAPTYDSTVAGTVTVSASATDNVGVVGVQFMLDGANLGAEDTTAPYAVSWNTTTAVLGPHVLTAVARDAAGNSVASTAVTVTVGALSTALLTNGSFEAFTGTVATGWTLVTDGVVSLTAAKVTGLTGFGQKITIATPGTWGWALSQKPAFKLNQTYEWILSYKTSGANSVWAQITDGTVSQVVLSQELAGTNGSWKQVTLTFTYTNAGADLLRLSADDAGGVWLDGFGLREIDAPLLANGGFEAFTGNVARDWKVTKDGVVAATPSKGGGVTGYGQKIVITAPGTWGLFLHQPVVLKAGAGYEWTLSYMTSGTESVWAQVSDVGLSHVVLSQELPGTSGAWRQETLTFTYSNIRADQLRISSNVVGSVWLDTFSLREVGAPIVSNGGMEFFTGNVATGWKAVKDGVVSATVAKGGGQVGVGQKVTITTPGTWGIYFAQQAVLQLGATYEWTFFYRTSGANAVWAQLGNAALDQVVLSAQLPGTSGVWTQRTLTFTYTNGRADLLRFSSNAIGSFWLDEVSVTEVAP
jgi:hypothetical protein